MKINEKHLVSFATGSAAVDKQGYLSKRGELNKSFQRRWFVLKGNLLYYFDKRNDSEPLGVIVVEGCSIELSENAEKFAFELNFMGSGTRTYVLAAETQVSFLLETFDRFYLKLWYKKEAWYEILFVM